jgi:hypothetical protein
MQTISVAAKCPACQTSIQSDHDLLSPRPGVIYRCHVCRLELVIDPVTDKPVLANEHEERGNDRRRAGPAGRAACRTRSPDA